MKTIAGAIVVLAGAVLWGAGTIAMGTPPSPSLRGALNHTDAGYVAAGAGAFLVLTGLVVLIIGLFSDREGRRPWGDVRRCDED